MDTEKNRLQAKPQSANELLALLEDERSDLSKGGRRLASFFITNPGDTALLTSAEVAQRCGVHASSVVRLAQGLGFSGYRELQSLFQKDLSASIAESRPLIEVGVAIPKSNENLRLHLLGESGLSFNEAARLAADRYCTQNPSVNIKSNLSVSHIVDPQEFAQQIESAATDADGLILVAREHPAINGAVRSVIGRGVPVVCLTTDLPSSTRTAFVGSDQFASGATAGWFCGRMLPNEKAGQVLFVYSVPFRCQLDREQGFRQILRTEFPALTIDERVSSMESTEVIYEAVRRYIAKFGPPSAIYNVSGANIGIGRALEDEGLGSKTIFIGHELNDNSRALLERGTMDLAIGHDFDREFAMSVECIRMALQGRQPVKHLTSSQLFTRYNCAIV
jgi:LacI family transcriptional regulator